MKIITFMNSKGGVGKTTLCFTLARAIQLDDPNAKILLVDADKSLKVWHSLSVEHGYGFDLIGATTRASLLSAKKLANESDVDFMLVDTGGVMTEIVGTAASISDTIIIPLGASPLDVWETLKSVDVIAAALGANPNIKPIFVMNSVVVNTTIVKDVIEALKNEAPSIPVADTIIHQRIVIKKMANEGKTIYEAKGKDKAQAKLAMAEIDNFTSELFRELFR